AKGPGDHHSVLTCSRIQQQTRAQCQEHHTEPDPEREEIALLLSNFSSQPRANDIECAVDCGQEKVFGGAEAVSLAREEEEVVEIVGDAKNVQPFEEEDLSLESARQHQAIS